ncbi:uncharacterized protein K02A2.6-like [Lineus longissimus]|uniref:uncharacterized protein K02A2.6-like n=1 Tax=Lineus longissimus TaxID=88925 RepID=UPI00315D3581
MSKTEYEKQFSHIPLLKTPVKLKTYTGDQISVCGKAHLNVKYKSQSANLPLIIVDHPGKPALLGRNWLEKLKLNWNKILECDTDSVHKLGETSVKDENSSVDHKVKDRLDLILRKYSSVFEDSYDAMHGHSAHIRIKEGAKPVFHKPRRVPYALREPVEAELKKLEENGVIEKVDHAEWASPIVVVPKTDKTVRICGDYKVSINPLVEDEQCTLPTTQDLYVQLAGSKVFSILDLSHAYAQLSVDPESRKYLNINTHKGIYTYTKLPYGVKSSPKIFQSKMDSILQGIPKCVCKQDDI